MKSYIVATTEPVFTPEQCDIVIKSGKEQPKQKAQVGLGSKLEQGELNVETRIAHVSWIPFDKLSDMYKKIEKTVHYQKIAVVCVSFFNSIRGPGPERVEFWEFG